MNLSKEGLDSMVSASEKMLDRIRRGGSYPDFVYATDNTVSTMPDKDFYRLPYESRKDDRQQCLHRSCSQCGGTGQRKDGLGPCIHMISCPCPICTPC